MCKKLKVILRNFSLVLSLLDSFKIPAITFIPIDILLKSVVEVNFSHREFVLCKSVCSLLLSVLYFLPWMRLKGEKHATLDNFYCLSDLIWLLSSQIRFVSCKNNYCPLFNGL